MCGPSLKKVGQGVLELLIGNAKVTDGQKDGQTDRHVQSNIFESPYKRYKNQDVDRIQDEKIHFIKKKDTKNKNLMNRI